MMQRAPAVAPKRSPWKRPVVELLPRLTDLTLSTGGGIPGDGVAGGSGSTVFS